MDINFKVKKIIVITGGGTDEIHIYPDLKTTFPEMRYSPIMKMEARQGYGIEYCVKNFDINPEVINLRLR